MKPAELRVQHAKFLRLAALGVNVFVSAGDAGAHPDETGHRPTGLLQVEYAASDPCVVAAGGTPLALSREAVYAMGFFGFWALGIASSTLTLFLESPPDRERLDAAAPGANDVLR